MRDRGWVVVGVDIDPSVEPDVVADVRAMPFNPFPVDLLWASIVCTEFSRWALPWIPRASSPPSLELALATKSIIDEWKPRAWVVECTLPSREFLAPIFGPVRAIVPGHAFWGTIAMFPQTHPHKDAGSRAGGRPRNPAVRSMIPYEIGALVAYQVENMPTPKVCCAKCRKLVHRDEAVAVTEDGVYMRICLNCIEDERIREPMEIEIDG
jgi:hypothetical protein